MTGLRKRYGATVWKSKTQLSKSSSTGLTALGLVDQPYLRTGILLGHYGVELLLEEGAKTPSIAGIGSSSTQPHLRTTRCCDRSRHLRRSFAATAHLWRGRVRYGRWRGQWLTVWNGHDRSRCRSLLDREDFVRMVDIWFADRKTGRIRRGPGGRRRRPAGPRRRPHPLAWRWWPISYGCVSSWWWW